VGQKLVDWNSLKMFLFFIVIGYQLALSGMIRNGYKSPP